MANQSIVPELVIAGVFVTVALLGSRHSRLWVGAGLILHGLFDFLHPAMISNSGAPLWWPPFCAGVDVLLGAWVLYLAQHERASN